VYPTSLHISTFVLTESEESQMAAMPEGVKWEARVAGDKGFPEM